MHLDFYYTFLLLLWLLSDTVVTTPTGAHDVTLMPFDHVFQVAAVTARLTAGVEPPYRTMTRRDTNIDISCSNIQDMAYTNSTQLCNHTMTEYVPY